MFKTVKSRVSLIYMVLVALILILGVVSLWDMVRISRSIDGLIATNYNSIKRLTVMREELRNQHDTLYAYLYLEDNDAPERFQVYSDRFMSSYNEEFATIVIPQEKIYIDAIGQSHQSYLNECNRIFACDLSVQKERILAEAIYAGSLKRAREKLEEQIGLLYSSNETALIERKNQAGDKARIAIWKLAILFPAAAAGAYLLATLYTRRFFSPLYEITQNIKQVRQGNLGRKTTITTEDEFGMLADEFNNMTKRLLEFERQAMGSIQSERNKSLSIVQSINEPLVILDGACSIRGVNHAFELLFDLKEADVTGRPFADAVRHPDLSDYIKNIARGKPSGEDKTILIGSPDKEQYFHVAGTALADQDGKRNGLILVLHDVTEMKLLEKARGDFIATISHEFKTPLTSIVMGTDLLSDAKLGGLNDDQREVLGAIREDGERLQVLVGELLELSRIESSKTIYHFTPCYVSRIVAASLQQFQALAERNEVSILAGNLIGLPPVRADVSKITWVVNNLLSNALKFTRPGDEIRIEARREADHVVVSVIDTGIGIPQEIADHLFEKFIHTRSYDIEMRGSGIGLAVSREIIAAHGGQIAFQSIIPVGSSFTFTLPLAKTEREGGNGETGTNH